MVRRPLCRAAAATCRGLGRPTAPGTRTAPRQAPRRRRIASRTHPPSAARTRPRPGPALTRRRAASRRRRRRGLARRARRSRRRGPVIASQRGAICSWRRSRRPPPRRCTTHRAERSVAETFVNHQEHAEMVESAQAGARCGVWRAARAVHCRRRAAQQQVALRLGRVRGAGARRGPSSKKVSISLLIQQV